MSTPAGSPGRGPRGKSALPDCAPRLRSQAADGDVRAPRLRSQAADGDVYAPRLRSQIALPDCAPRKFSVLSHACGLESPRSQTALPGNLACARTLADKSTPAGTGPMRGCPARVPSATGRGPRGKSALPDCAPRLRSRKFSVLSHACGHEHPSRDGAHAGVPRMGTLCHRPGTPRKVRAPRLRFPGGAPGR
jgi:hypothetical protein